MTAHLSDAELRQFTEGTLGAATVLRVDDHLAECADCRRRAATLGGATTRVGELHAALIAPASHLSERDVQQLVAGQLPPEAIATAREHLESCGTCAAAVKDLSQWSGRARPQRLPWLAAAAVFLAVTVAGAIWWPRSRHVESAASLAGIESLAEADQARVRADAASGAPSLPAFLGELRTPPEVLMGTPAPAGATFDLLSPTGTGVLSDRPRFEWRPLAGASGYVLTVFDERGNTIATSGTLDGTNWTPATALARDRTYVWQVAASRGDRTITVPAAPAPPARFHVIDARTADSLRRLEAEHPSAHLLLGIVNAQSGLPQEAIKHLQEVPATDPYAATAQRMLDALKAWR